MHVHYTVINLRPKNLILPPQKSDAQGEQSLPAPWLLRHCLWAEAWGG